MADFDILLDYSKLQPSDRGKLHFRTCKTLNILPTKAFGSQEEARSRPIEMKTFIRRLSSRSEEAAFGEGRQAPMAASAAGGRGSILSASFKGSGKVVDFSAAWSRIHTALQLLTSDTSQTLASSWLALYTDVYRLCITPEQSGAQRRLYDHLHDFLCTHCEAVVADLHTASESHTAFQFLILYTRLFCNYLNGMEIGGKILAYLDRYWITKHHQRRGMEPINGVMAVAELVPLIWRQRVLLRDISQLIQRAFNAVVAELRAADAVPPSDCLSVLRAAVESFVLLGRTLEPTNPIGFYKEQLEDHLLKQVYLHYAERAAIFQRQVSTGHVSEATVAEYIREVQRCILAEQAIWSNVYSSTSRGAVRVVRKSMLESQPHHQILMAFANAALAFRAERLEDLALLYHLLDNEDVDPAKGIDALRQIFFIFVKELGTAEIKRINDRARLEKSSPTRPDMAHILARPSLPADYVSSDAIQAMLDLYSHYLNLVRVIFGEDPRFAKAFKSACEQFTNHMPNMSESLALHAHYFLDRNCPESRTESIDVALDSIILLFNFIQDKDLFHRSYARLLANRIINFTSVSDEAERRMMKHLMQLCGFQYAMTFQRMFMDKSLSVELSNDFRRWEREREQRGIMGRPADDSELQVSHHPRRKSDSAIEFIETESGHVTPKSVSPKLNPGPRFIGIHDASPLQMLLSKRVFADKNKKYKADPLSSASSASHAYTSRAFFNDHDDALQPPAADAWSSLATGAGTSARVGSGPEVDFFVFVLTGGSWPYHSTGHQMPLPSQLQHCVDTFSAFYDAKYKRRRLTWLHDLGHGEILWRCSERHYTLAVSTAQMSALLLFNLQPCWTVQGILSVLQVNPQDLILFLYPLIKSRVLAVSPSVLLASELSPHHQLTTNDSFARRPSRISVPRKCDEAELPHTMDVARSMDPGRISPSLLNERKSAIEARIVHLMKKAGTLRHDRLIQGVFEHTKRMNFLPPVEFVCEVIRSDIDKDFIEIAEDGPNPLYRYQR